MGGTILLADDSLTIQKVVELTFAETEHSVVAVGGGRELLERLPEVRPDVILCDVVMPDMTGYDVCQALKSDPSRLHIPVVLLTGTFEPFDRDRAMASGCDAIVTKPFEARELIDTVEQLISRTKALAVDAGEPSAEGIGVPEGLPALDFTTTGFDKMVPPQPAPLAPPEEGIELTASVTSPPASAAASPAPAREIAPEPGEQTAPPFALEPPAAGSPLAREEGPWSAPSAGVSPPIHVAAGHPVEAAPAAEVSGFEPIAAAAASSAPAALGQQGVPGSPQTEPPVETSTADSSRLGSELTEAQIEQIARRVVEIASSQIEKIAWEVIPDMAEMIVRQRIQELETAAEKEG